MTIEEKRERNRQYQQRYRAEHPGCRQEESRKYYASHRKIVIEASRKWHAVHPEKSREFRRRYEAKHREELREALRKRRIANPDISRSEQIAERNIPLADVCEVCGGKAAERHHPDYSEPLSVMHVCLRCHKALDKERRKNENATAVRQGRKL